MSKVLATINASALKSQEKWIAQRDDNLVRAKTITEVEDNEQLESAGQVESEAKKLIKLMDEERKSLTRKLDAAKKAIMNTEKDMTADLVKESTRINRLMSDYATKQLIAAREAQRKREQAERDAAEAQAQAEAEAEAKAQAAFESKQDADPFAPAEEPEPIPEPAPVPEPGDIPYVERPNTSTNSFLFVTKFEVQDQSKVAREFLSVDESKIREFLSFRKKMGDDMDRIQLQGIKVWQEAQVRTR